MASAILDSAVAGPRNLGVARLQLHTRGRQPSAGTRVSVGATSGARHSGSARRASRCAVHSNHCAGTRRRPTERRAIRERRASLAADARGRLDRPTRPVSNPVIYFLRGRDRLNPRLAGSPIFSVAARQAGAPRATPGTVAGCRYARGVALAGVAAMDAAGAAAPPPTDPSAPPPRPFEPVRTRLT